MTALLEFINRSAEPEPWAEGEKIPWNDPEFSRRMLAVHLNQENDWASRRLGIVDKHVDWITNHLLLPKSAVLDLGCGPGLYTSRLAGRGHRCVGIDFSPASIAFAEKSAAEDGLDVRYYLADVRAADFGVGFDLVMMLFGEFNVFRPEDASDILKRAYRALRPGGHLLIEGHLLKEVMRQGLQPAWWQTMRSGLFSDRPHLLLEEHFWHKEARAATTRYAVVFPDGTVERCASTMQAYSTQAYGKLFSDAGYVDISRYPNMNE